MVFKRKKIVVKEELYWKEKNKEYLKQLQKFLDVANNIENEELKNNVIIQMLKCDKILTNLAIKEIRKYKADE